MDALGAQMMADVIGYQRHRDSVHKVLKTELVKAAKGAKASGGGPVLPVALSMGGIALVALLAALLVGGGVMAALGLVAAQPALAIAGIALHGVGTGATIAVRSAAFGDVFGGTNFGTIFGLLRGVPHRWRTGGLRRRGRFRQHRLVCAGHPGDPRRGRGLGGVAVDRGPAAGAGRDACRSRADCASRLNGPDRAGPKR